MYYTQLSSLTPAFARCLLRTAISNTMHSVTIAYTAMLKDKLLANTCES